MTRTIIATLTLTLVLVFQACVDEDNRVEEHERDGTPGSEVCGDCDEKPAPLDLSEGTDQYGEAGGQDKRPSDSIEKGPGNFIYRNQTGAKNMLCIIATLEGESSSSISPRAFPWLGDQVAEMFLDNSYGKMQLTVDWTQEMVQLPGNAASYLDPDDRILAMRTHRDARIAAEIADYDVDSYDWVVVFVRKFWEGQFSWTGYNMNARHILMGAGGTRLFAHELAHVLRSSTNLTHNTFVHTEPESTNPFRGTILKYGDGFFILGGQAGPNETHATELFGFHRLNVGWLEHENVPRVTASGGYEIARIDSDPGGKVMALRIPRDNSELFVSWLNYEGAESFARAPDPSPVSRASVAQHEPRKSEPFHGLARRWTETRSDIFGPGLGNQHRICRIFQSEGESLRDLRSAGPPNPPVLDLVSPMDDGVNMVGTVEFELTAYQGRKVNGHNVRVDVLLKHDSSEYGPGTETTIPGLKATWSFEEPPFVFEYDFENPGEPLGIYKLTAIAEDKTTGKKSRMTLKFYRDDGS